MANLLFFSTERHYRVQILLNFVYANDDSKAKMKEYNLSPAIYEGLCHLIEKLKSSLSSHPAGSQVSRRKLSVLYASLRTS